MTVGTKEAPPLVLAGPLTKGERIEMAKLGLLDKDGNPYPTPAPNAPLRSANAVKREAITNHGVLNEAYDYASPVSFARGLRVDLVANSRLLLISGTSAVDEHGASIYVGDFRGQCWRTYMNITELLKSEGATWQDIVRTTCYLRDIERDYDVFNEIRTYFFRSQGLDPMPASTGIQARLCRSDLLIEIEAFAILQEES